jgi:hypothetical protein
VWRSLWRVLGAPFAAFGVAPSWLLCSQHERSTQRQQKSHPKGGFDAAKPREGFFKLLENLKAGFFQKNLVGAIGLEPLL